MNRRPFVYAGSLVAGLLLTFVVAFLAWWHTGFSCQAPSWIVHNALPLSEQDRTRWLRHRSHSWPERPPGICTESRSLSVHRRLIAVTVMGGGFVRFDETSEQRRERRRGTGRFSVARIVYGFPWPCFELETWQESGSIDVAGIGPVQHDGWEAFGHPMPAQVLAVRLLVNTIFWACAVWLLTTCPARFRRLIWLKRGLCPKCAYPTGESAVCTECGRELPNRAKVTT